MSALPTAVIHTVVKVRYVGLGEVERPREFQTGHTLPWRILRRPQWAHRIGLEFLHVIGREGDVVAVTVSDGKRALASWRRMEGWSGFTGTHDVHPLIAEILTGETLGAVLVRACAA